MTTNLSRFKSDLATLLKLGNDMLNGDLLSQHYERTDQMTEERRKIAGQHQGAFQTDYQKWYTEALPVVRQILPDRLVEFQELYKGAGTRREIDAINYHIQDWLNGIRAPTRHRGKPVRRPCYRSYAFPNATRDPAISRTTL